MRLDAMNNMNNDEKEIGTMGAILRQCNLLKLPLLYAA